MKEKKRSDMEQCNFTSMLLYGILNAILIISYLMELIKKSRTIGYFVVFCMFAMIPYILCLVAYRKDSETQKLKYGIAVGFSAFYLFVLFTTVSPVAYVYALMLATILLCYSDFRLVALYMLITVVGNIVQVIVMAVNHQIVKEDSANLEIRIASVIVFGCFMIVTTKVTTRINQNKMELIEEEKERIGELMERILNVSDRITADIGIVSEKMNVLESTANKTQLSMKEVALGTGETVDSIQVQLEKTEKIQQTIQHVRTSSDTITQNVQGTKQEIGISKANIEDLIEHVHISNEANANVSRELDELLIYTNQMQSIIQLIDGITEQTSLLSLNASIEAARAGESGRGFAVVASEISALATQTQQATVNITDLIENISKELEAVVKMIEKMISNADAQNEVANQTARSFDKIAEQIAQVDNATARMNKLVGELTSANTAIVQGIETISSATEEVTAHSTVTLEASEENSNITNEVGVIVEGLNRLAEELSNMRA